MPVLASKKADEIEVSESKTVQNKVSRVGNHEKVTAEDSLKCTLYCPLHNI